MINSTCYRRFVSVEWRQRPDEDCDPPREEAIANAHLIAAAPDLYEAIDWFLVKWRDVENAINSVIALQCARTGQQYNGPTIDKELEALRAALTKARGEQP